MNNQPLVFSGRERELELLRRYWDQTKTGVGNLVFISGQAGIGKSELLKSFIKSIDNETIVLNGYCMDYCTSSPLHPFKIAFREFAESNVQKKDYKKMLKKTLPSLMKIMPIIGDIASGAVSSYQDMKEGQSSSALGESQEDLFFQILTHLTEWSKKQPVLVLIEDLQYADPSTLSFLLKLADAAPNNRFLVIGTYSEENFGTNKNLKMCLHELEIRRLKNIITLSPMSEKEMLNIYPGANEEARDFIGRLYSKCEGNPYYMKTMIEYLEESKFIERRNDGYTILKEVSMTEIPQGIKSVVLKKLEQLDSEERLFLDKCSILGKEFSPDHAADLNDIGIIPALELLRKIENIHRLIKEIDELYAFDSELSRDIIYDDLSKRLRIELHRKMVKFLEENEDDEDSGILGQLIYHCLGAGLNDEAARYFIRAGKLAWKDFGSEEAINAYSEAMSMSKDPCMKIEALLEQSIVNQAIGKVEQAKKNISDVQSYLSQCQDKNLKGRIILQEADINMSIGQYDLCDTLLNKALDYYKGMEDITGIGKTYAYLGRLADIRHQYDLATEMYTKSLEIYENIDKQDMIASLYCDMGNIALANEDFDKALDYYKKSLVIDERLDDRQGIAANYGNMGMTYVEMGKYEEALDLYTKALKIDEEINNVNGKARTLSNIGRVFFEKGNYDKSIEVCEESLRITRKIGDRKGIGLSLNNLGFIYLSKGETVEALKYYRQSLMIYNGLNLEYEILDIMDTVQEIINEQESPDKGLDLMLSAGFEKSEAEEIIKMQK